MPGPHVWNGLSAYGKYLRRRALPFFAFLRGPLRSSAGNPVSTFPTPFTASLCPRFQQSGSYLPSASSQTIAFAIGSRSSDSTWMPLLDFSFGSPVATLRSWIPLRMTRLPGFPGFVKENRTTARRASLHSEACLPGHYRNVGENYSPQGLAGFSTRGWAKTTFTHSVPLPLEPLCALTASVPPIGRLRPQAPRHHSFSLSTATGGPAHGSFHSARIESCCIHRAFRVQSGNSR